MNSRMRVKAIPAIVATSLGLNLIGDPAKIFAHEGHTHAKSMQPTGFEELNLTIDEDGVTGMPESLDAGRYLINVTGPEPGEMGPSGFVIVQLPEGVTAEQAYEDMQSATQGPPEWYLDTHWGGGLALTQGTEGWVVLDLTPGSWHVTTLMGTALATPFEVTGEFPEDSPEPEADVVLDMFEMDFSVVSGEFVAGDNITTMHNSGGQLHFVEILKVPDDTTEEQVEMLFNSYMTGTPEVGMMDEASIMPVYYAPDQSPGVSMTHQITLEAGMHLFTCWVPDPETGLPHAMTGMHELVDVPE